MKVLLVEDDHSFTETMKLFFEIRGDKDELICANTIDKALQIINQGKPDIVLVDLILGTEYAYPILDKLQSIPCKSILMSASPSKVKEAASQYNINMLSKPFELEELEKYLK